MKKLAFILAFLLLSSPAFAAIRLLDEGTSQGFINEINCAGAGVSCARSGIRGTLTIGGGLVSSVSNSDGTLTISPTTGDIVASLALGHANTWTGQQTFNTSAAIFGVGAVTPKIYPASNSTTAVQILKADGSTGVVDVDTTNSRVGIGTSAPATAVHVKATSGSAETRTETTDSASFSRTSNLSDNGQTSFNQYGSAFAGTVSGINKAGLGLVFSTGTPGLMISSSQSGSAAPMYFDVTNVSPAVTILATGNVGIGASPGSSRLLVSGGPANIGSGGAATLAGDLGVSREASATTGVLYFGNSGSVFQYWDGTSYEFIGGRMTINSNAVNSTSMLKLVSNGTGIKGIENINAASQTTNNYEAQNSSLTNYFFVGPDTLAGDSTTKNFLNLTATLPTTLTAQVNGVLISLTGAGSSSQNVISFKNALNAGWTGTGVSAGLLNSNASAGTGTSYFNGGSANYGLYNTMISTTAGTNLGAINYASGGNVSIGAFNQSTVAKNSASNWGEISLGRNTGSSPTEGGAYIGMDSAAPTLTSAALLVNNSDQAVPVAIFQDNGTAVFTIADGGAVTDTSTLSATGFQISGAAASGKFLVGNGTSFIASTSTIPTSAGATANKVLLSDGTNYVLSTPTFPNASATSGKFIRSDGTNWIASTPTLPTSAGTAGKHLRSDGTNYVESTPTFADTATSAHVLRGDGTNWLDAALSLTDLNTFSSANVATQLTDEVGTGNVMFNTSPKVITALNDTNNNEWIKVTATGSAVNEITVANAATNNNPTISATGDDTNVGINLTAKGTGAVVVTSTSTSPSAFSTGMIGALPAAQTIAATDTITADSCGGIKRISSAGAVTTNTTNTFTAPAAGNASCFMYVCNTGSNNITLDNNANFKSSGAADVVMTADDCVEVGSTGGSGVWYQLSALEAN